MALIFCVPDYRGCYRKATVTILCVYLRCFVVLYQVVYNLVLAAVDAYGKVEKRCQVEVDVMTRGNDREVDFIVCVNKGESCGGHFVCITSTESCINSPRILPQLDFK